MNRQRGFALLIVLWTMGLLALLVGQFIATGRSEVQMATNLRANAVTEAAADGALNDAILRLLKRTWLPDARPHAIRVGDAVVEVRIKDQSWKVNPNEATLPALTALLAAVGDTAKASALARAIVDWRTPVARPRPGGSRVGQERGTVNSSSQIFDSVDEIGLVPGITPALVAKLKPYLSVFLEGDALGAGDTLPRGVLDASARTTGDGWHFGSTGRVMLVSIEATASSPRGGQFTRRAVVRLREEASLDQAPYQILTWETSEE
jgi:general secretion pathway protein K